MDRHAIKLTIGGMTGAYAEKYSLTVPDAHLLDRLLQEATARSRSGPLDLLTRHDEPRAYDAFKLMPRVMKQLQKVSLEHAERRFYTGVRAEPRDGEPGPWLDSVGGTDDGAMFTLHGFGRKLTLVRATEAGAASENLGKALDFEPSETERVVLETGDAAYRVRYGLRRDLFRDPLERIVNMCEEALAKNQTLIATVVDADGATEMGGAGLPDYDQI